MESENTRGRKRYLDKTHRRGSRGYSPDWYFKIRQDKRIAEMKLIKRDILFL